MTPKEKAEELVNKFYSKTDEERVLVNKYWSSAKYCAFIAVDEIIKANPTGEYGDPFIGNKVYNNKSYWRGVKEEIEKL